MECEFDVLIIGAGVIGLSVGKELAEAGYTAGILEKNSKYGLDTSSRNSEVLHSGIHYQPGSLKAKLCVEGIRLLYEFCERRNILYRKTGKVTVAVTEEELPELEKLYNAGIANGAEEMVLLSAGDVKKQLPEAECVGGLFTGTSGIINVHMLMDSLYREFISTGGLCGLEEKAVGIDYGNEGYTVYVEGTPLRKYTARVLINCAGLFADRISGMLGIDYNLHWAKGDYFSIEQKFEIDTLVYPVPGKDSLGIHLTPKMGGGLRAGPDIEYVEKKLPPYPDEKTASGYMVDEGKKVFFYGKLKRYLPALSEDGLSPEMYGIRAKLQGPSDGFTDFVIKEEKHGFINLVGIESPGLTSCLAIAGYVRDMVKNAI
ncbi:MAG: NAD(P)/FAD-dependent oxidoreductase [Candidatus Omnitrophica bacterium]|nr:NAD(P)/FAD-dependent oxidoreductase [Candidatus Omnitrophota bacterium]